MAALEKTNSLDNVKKLVVWSMDVEKLYPSLKADEVSKLVGKAFLESELEVDVNTDDLSLYLALTVDRKELVKRGLGRVTHTRKSDSNNSLPGITIAEVFAKQNAEAEEDLEDEEEEEEEREVPFQSSYGTPRTSPEEEDEGPGPGGRSQGHHAGPHVPDGRQGLPPGRRRTL